ncbi:type II toxin-antitoxin system Phd/YefM family antitoxin [Pseudoxanthomonas winnipegensis]|uniref:type II toxin-antitoxin system Phd/YefM family antitoxin n=1 Tax=Pseudoxanthomonas winnipegensis TaxID=2480810 RepID=UPI0030F3F154
MRIQTFTSRQYNQEPGTLKRAVAHGPVFVTNREVVELVLLTKRDYDQLIGAKPKRKLGDAMRMPGVADIEFEPVRSNVVMREVDLG